MKYFHKSSVFQSLLIKKKQRVPIVITVIDFGVIL